MFGTTQPPVMPMQPRGFTGGETMSRDMTGYDLDMGPVASRGAGGLNVQFFYDRVRVENPAVPEINGTWQTRLYVAKQPKGDRLTIACHEISEAMAAQMFPAEFSAFKMYEAVPTNGTPLSELPGISQAQIGQCVLYGLRSIEDLAACPTEQVNGTTTDVLQAHKVAKRWVEQKDAAAPLIKAAQDDMRMQNLQDQNAKLMQQVAALSAQVEIMTRVQSGMPQGAAPAQMGGMQAMVAAYALEQSIAADPLPPANLFEGGMVTDNSDLDDGGIELPGLDETPRRGRR